MFVVSAHKCLAVRSSDDKATKLRHYHVSLRIQDHVKYKTTTV